MEAIEPKSWYIDSIQTLHTDYINHSGSISQIRETTADWSNLLKKYSRDSNGHITKTETLRTKDWNTWWTPFYSLKAIEITCINFTFLKNRFSSTAEDWYLWNVVVCEKFLIHPKYWFHTKMRIIWNRMHSTLEHATTLMIEIKPYKHMFMEHHNNTTGYNAKRLIWF
jgi:DNA repair protein RadA/Sms